MFKTKLQELCHQRSWALPSYSCGKHGPDHTPLFQASVFVHGVSFDSPVTFKSSKDALNDAAKVAFLHLNTGVEASAVGAKVDMSSHFNPSSSDIKAGQQHHPHKLQLQQFAQSKNLDPPVYSSKREGPPHALQFQATVTIGGHSFESPGYFKHLKEAEQAASKIALLSLSLDVLQEIDVRSYKNLLQELTQNQGLTLSEFQTVWHGPPHRPMFFSTVEIEGNFFHGKRRKSKKLAELSAAKAAYLLMKHEDDDVLMKSIANSNANSLWSSLKKGESVATILAPPNLSSLSITASETKKKVETGNYLLCNKVRVYTSIPRTKFPEGTVCLPIGEHKWIVVSLEFPNQKVN